MKDNASLATATGSSCSDRRTAARVRKAHPGKEHIFLELVRQHEPEALAHAGRLGELEPTAQGLRNLHGWLQEWGRLYDEYAMVFLECPASGWSRMYHLRQPAL